MTRLELINDFLGQKRIAVAGVSRQANDFSRMLYREFQKRGYDCVPVNPEGGDVEGQHCFGHVGEIQPPVDGVLVMTKPAVTETLVRECADAGVPRVWMFRGGGKGAVSDAAVGFCKAKGISVIAGECPFMFLPGSGFIHSVHGFVRKIVGTYPS